MADNVKKYRVVLALVLATEDPEFWRNKDNLKKMLGDRADQVEALRFHNIGVIHDEDKEVPVTEE